MDTSVFAARDLTKVYRTGEVEVRALRGLTFEIAVGEVVVLLGPSGSGKSTLLNIMGGLDQATSGRLLFKELDLTSLDDRGLTAYRRRHVGFVFQFYNLVPSLTAYENVALVTEISENPMRPEEALALVGLEERMDHFPAQLSGGEQQRVAIARTLMQQPAIILADEPVSSLDPKLSRVILDILKRVCREDGITALVSLHTLELTREYADRVIGLKAGQILFDGATKDLTDAVVDAVYQRKG